MGNRPQFYITGKPQGHSVWLAGVCIDLTAIAHETGLGHGYLSRVLSGKSNPSVPYLRRLADILGMSIDSLLTAIDERRNTPIR